MVLTLEFEIESLGIEPKEVLGFETEEDLEQALIPLMQVQTD